MDQGGGFLNWWQTLITVFGTIIITKIADVFYAQNMDKLNYKKYRRELTVKELEALINEFSVLYELAGSWKGFKEKQPLYLKIFENMHELTGRFNKYGPDIVQAARDVAQWCSIVASEEKKGKAPHQEKEEMGKEYKVFLKKCNDYLDKLS